MAGHRDLMAGDRRNLVRAMRGAIDAVRDILADPLVSSQRGYAYTDDDAELLDRSREVLDRFIPEPATRVQRLLNEKTLDEASRGLVRADGILRRQGLFDVMSAGDQVLEGDAFSEKELRRVQGALERFDRATAHGRN